MLQAIWMPQPASVPKYVQERHLVSLTHVETQSCGQPLLRYPASGYERRRQHSDTRCRSGTKSGGFRSKCGKRPRSENFRPDWASVQEGSTVAWSTSRIGILSRTGYTRPHSVHFSASGSTFRTSGFLHTGQTKISSSSWGIMLRILPLDAQSAEVFVCSVG
jgi:hypothetical protein